MLEGGTGITFKNIPVGKLKIGVKKIYQTGIMASIGCGK
jgi:hypothetical protein